LTQNRNVLGNVHHLWTGRFLFAVKKVTLPRIKIAKKNVFGGAEKNKQLRLKLLQKRLSFFSRNFKNGTFS